MERRYGTETLSYITMEQTRADWCLKCGHFCNSQELWEWVHSGNTPKCLHPGCTLILNLGDLPPQQSGAEGEAHVLPRLRLLHASPHVHRRAAGIPGYSQEAAITIGDEVVLAAPTEEEVDAEVQDQRERYAELQNSAPRNRQKTGEGKLCASEGEAAEGEQPAGGEAAGDATGWSAAGRGWEPQAAGDSTGWSAARRGWELQGFRNRLPQACEPLNLNTAPDKPSNAGNELSHCMCLCCSFEKKACGREARQLSAWSSADGSNMVRFLCSRCWWSETQQRRKSKPIEFGWCHNEFVDNHGCFAGGRPADEPLHHPADAPPAEAEILAAPAEAPPADAPPAEAPPAVAPPAGELDWADAAWCEGCDLGFDSLKAVEEHEADCQAYLKRFDHHH